MSNFALEAERDAAEIHAQCSTVNKAKTTFAALTRLLKLLAMQQTFKGAIIPQSKTQRSDDNAEQNPRLRGLQALLPNHFCLVQTTKKLAVRHVVSLNGPSKCTVFYASALNIPNSFY